jgi:hypothetical protein
MVERQATVSPSPMSSSTSKCRSGKAVEARIAPETGIAVDEEQVDVLFEGEANEVVPGLGGRERDRTRCDTSSEQSLSALVQHRCGSGDVVAGCSQLRDDQLSRRTPRQRLCEQEQRIETEQALGRHENRAVGRREVERRLLLEDCAMQLLECGAGLDPELVNELLPRAPERVKCVTLPAVTVEREHEQCTELFSKRIRRRELPQSPDDLCVPAESELGLDLQLERREA